MNTLRNPAPARAIRLPARSQGLSTACHVHPSAPASDMIRAGALSYDVIDRDGFVAIRTVANGCLDLEDALDGAGHLQEGEWVAMDDGDIVPFRGLDVLDGLQPKGGSRWNGSMTG